MSIFQIQPGPNDRRGGWPPVSLRCERLEDRVLLACEVTAYENGDTKFLEIDGTNQADQAFVTFNGVQTSVKVELKCGNAAPKYFTIGEAEVDLILFEGHDGSDRFENHTDRPSVVWGGYGQDILIGGSGTDLMHGGPDDDQIEGNGSLDVLAGGGGSDTVSGQAGDDRLYGDACFEQYDNVGQWGCSWLNLNAAATGGAAGLDELYGGTGHDRLDGGGDHLPDVLHGGLGVDTYVFHIHTSRWGQKYMEQENVQDWESIIESLSPNSVRAATYQGT